MTTPLTAGELIRALMPHYDYSSYALNVAVSNHRANYGSKNWHAAATDILESFREAEQLSQQD